MNAAQQQIEDEDRAERAEKLARLSSACRQAGAMLESGVDILSVTRILRAQTEDEDILRLCARIDYDLKQGRALAQALADEPNLFSPFMVTLIRQGEERNTLPQAFARVSAALDAERNELLQALPAPASRSIQAPASTRGEDEQPQVLVGASAESQSLSDSQVLAHKAAMVREARWLRAASSIGAGLLAASAVAEFLTALGLGAKWQRPLSRALSAGVLALAARQARQAEAMRGDQVPQVLAAAPAEAPAEILEVRHENAQEPAAWEPVEAPPLNVASKARALANQEAAEDEPGANAVYRGAPREDEEDEAPRRPVRRPRGEEEFD